jgi:asparagine synthase (glutamine-hydrolysing)
LDYKLVELLATIPSEYKLKRLTRKYIFKKAMQGIIPEKIIWRKKAGFGAPIRSWIVNDLKPLIDDVLSESSLKNRGIFNHAAVQKLLRDEYSGKEYNSNHIWQLLTLEMWFRTFIDRK